MNPHRITILVHCLTHHKEHGNVLATFTNPTTGAYVTACMWGRSNAVALARSYARGGDVYSTVTEASKRRVFSAHWDLSSIAGTIEGKAELERAMARVFPARKSRGKV